MNFLYDSDISKTNKNSILQDLPCVSSKITNCTTESKGGPQQRTIFNYRIHFGLFIIFGVLYKKMSLNDKLVKIRFQLFIFG